MSASSSLSYDFLKGKYCLEEAREMRSNASFFWRSLMAWNLVTDVDGVPEMCDFFDALSVPTPLWVINFEVDDCYDWLMAPERNDLRMVVADLSERPVRASSATWLFLVKQP